MLPQYLLEGGPDDLLDGLLLLGLSAALQQVQTQGAGAEQGRAGQSG